MQPRLEGSRTAVLRLHGEVDFFSEDGFRAEAEGLLIDGLEEFIVDLGDVAMLDSSGLSLLVDLLRLCREMGVVMLVRNVPDHVQQLLDLTGLDQILAGEESTVIPGHGNA